MVKKSLISKLKLPTESLSSFASINFNLAYTYNADFDRIEKKIGALENLSYETFITQSRKNISRENRKRLAILIKGKKVDEKSFGYTETTAKELTSTGR